MFIERRLKKNERQRLTLSIDSILKKELERLCHVHKTSKTKLIEALIRDFSKRSEWESYK